jgi:hypothetical protein
MSKGRVTIESGNYLWDGDRTLVGLTSDIHVAMKGAMNAAIWPFIEGLATWKLGSEESAIITFVPNEFFYKEDAIYELERHMPLLKPQIA